MSVNALGGALGRANIRCQLLLVANRLKLDKRRLKANGKGAFDKVAGNVFQASIDLKNKIFAILFVWQKGVKRRGPGIEIEEDVRTVKWSSLFIEIKLFRIL